MDEQTEREADYIRRGTMNNAEYQARNWALGKSSEELAKEITRCEEYRTYQWNEVGNAHAQYLRLVALRAILSERN